MAHASLPSPTKLEVSPAWKMHSLESLPLETCENILSFLPIESLAALHQSSKSLKNRVESFILHRMKNPAAQQLLCAKIVAANAVSLLDSLLTDERFPISYEAKKAALESATAHSRLEIIDLLSKKIAFRPIDLHEHMERYEVYSRCFVDMAAIFIKNKILLTPDQSGNKVYVLTVLAQLGNLNLLSTLLEESPVSSEELSSILKAAVQSRQEEIADYILDKGAISDEARPELINLAMRMGDLNVIRKLLNGSMSAQERGKLAYHALLLGELNVFNLLISEGPIDVESTENCIRLARRRLDDYRYLENQDEYQLIIQQLTSLRAG